jgi:long-subunit acyl-CoA synthetase (AMP-forming)
VVEYTWRQMLDEAPHGGTSRAAISSPVRIAMLSRTAPIVSCSIWPYGWQAVPVAIFPTESAANVRYVLEHSEASLCSWASSIPGNSMPWLCPMDCRASRAAPPQTDFDTWDAIVRTEPQGGRPSRGAEDLAMLLYTSGSTGQPKGVMQNFHNITRTAELRISDAHTRLPDNVERRVLSYLPLAHVYERAVVECCTFVEGRGRVFFTESLATFLEDIKRARPTAFVSVPRLWLKFQQGVFLTMPAHKLDAMLDDPAIATEVGRKVLAGLGLDEVRIAVSASAPIPGELLGWYRRLGLNLIEGYGMTEDLGYSHRTTEEANLLGHVGVPFPDVQVRIAEDGEVLIKSPGQLVGYYKRPDLDAASFTEDRFFRTGDLGVRRSDGQLRITGRVKELFKTAKGEYVAPAPIEYRLNAHPMVEMVMVSGVGQPAPYAIVVLAESLRAQLGDPAVRARVDAELGKLLHKVNENLATFERLHVLVVAREPWSVENGCLTPTMKIKRSRIEAALAAQVGAWYAEKKPVVWA